MLEPRDLRVRLAGETAVLYVSIWAVWAKWRDCRRCAFSSRSSLRGIWTVLTGEVVGVAALLAPVARTRGMMAVVSGQRAVVYGECSRDATISLCV